MKWFLKSKRPPAMYIAPASRAHRGFAYLDNDIVINSLSALESGKVDEVVEKINLAQERGLSVGLKVGSDKAGGTADAGGKSTESLQAEVIRRRTRFSIFELWYEALESRKAVGRFNGWGPDALLDVEIGHVVEIRGRLELAPVQTLFRMFLWFVDEVRAKNHLFKGSNLSDLQEQEKTIKFMLGKRAEVNTLLVPNGESGPAVLVSFLDEWVIESVGKWNGSYSLIAQVEEIVGTDDTRQTMRIIDDAPLTKLEKDTIDSALEPFRGNAEAFGIDMGDSNAEVRGPALVLRPIALFR